MVRSFCRSRNESNHLSWRETHWCCVTMAVLFIWLGVSVVAIILLTIVLVAVLLRKSTVSRHPPDETCDSEQMGSIELSSPHYDDNVSYAYVADVEHQYDTLDFHSTNCKWFASRFIRMTLLSFTRARVLILRSYIFYWKSYVCDHLDADNMVILVFLHHLS